MYIHLIFMMKYSVTLVILAIVCMIALTIIAFYELIVEVFNPQF
jgi:hypothetical protein